MGTTESPVEVPYPPAPWYLLGHLWAGFFTTDAPPALPTGLRPFLAGRWRVVMLVRYLDGTRRYDELVLGALARRKARPGLYVEHIWVTDAAGLWGGRRIWGLPKEF